MSTTHLKESLAKAPETEVKVSLELHRDIMRAVKLAGSRNFILKGAGAMSVDLKVFGGGSFGEEWKYPPRGEQQCE